MDLQQQIIDLHKQYPNDMELGRQVRVMAWHLMREEGQIQDPNQLTLWSEEELEELKK